MPIERNRGNKQLIGGLAEASRENPIAVIRISNDAVFRSGKEIINPTFQVGIFPLRDGIE